MYKTNDMYFAAYLNACGYPITPVSVGFGTSEFCFDIEQNSVLTKEVAAYFANSASVNPIAYADALRTIKSIVAKNKQSNDRNYFINDSRKENTAIVSR